MNKKIVRWTIGNVSDEGVECLRLSVSNFIKFYDYQYDYYICHNQIDPARLKWTNAFKINLLNQDEYVNSLIIPPLNNHPCWKLYPPRIKLDSHELFVDNDVLIYKNIDIEKLFDLSFFISEGLERSYGFFDPMIDPSFPKINTGFFSIPPSFDFKLHLNYLISHYDLKWKNHFDEQGLVAKIFSSKEFKLIPIQDINVSFDNPFKGKFGMHFIGLNSGNTSHWKRFKIKF
jgi:hypothetical protein